MDVVLVIGWLSVACIGYFGFFVKNNKFKIRGTLISGALILVCFTTIGINGWLKETKRVSAHVVGVQAVGYLYNFSNLEELDRNMEKLRKITTEEVYEQLTIDNTNRALSTYLKFKGKPSYVTIDDQTNSYVSYHLKTAEVASSRKFIFMYNVNSSGLIDKVREVEAIDFISDI